MPRQFLVFCACVLFHFNTNAGQFNANVSYGYEKITSPLVSVDFDAPLILVEGITTLSAHYKQLNLGIIEDWEMSDDLSFDVSSNILVKDAIETKDLNFSIASADATLRKKYGSSTFSVGPSIQRIWVAKSAFRDSISVQTDYTYIEPNGTFTDIYLGLSKNYFSDEFDFYNSKTSTISLTHHLTTNNQIITGLDIQTSINKEKNLKDFEDLSNYSYYGRLSVDKVFAGLTWSVGASINKSFFEKPFSEGFDKRRDNYITYEFSVEREIDKTFSVTLELSKARNSSNLALFDSKYQSFNLSLNMNY